jgi:hypothetical protein
MGELTKIWGYGHHETMGMGHFESWVPLEPCYCLGFLRINEHSINYITHQCFNIAIENGHL